MDALVKNYLDLVGNGKNLPLITENEIVFGRVSLKVSPSVLTPVAGKILLEFPCDLSPGEAAVPFAFKVCLVGYDGVMALMARIQASLAAGYAHEEQLGVWRIRCSEKGAFQTIEATRIS